MEEFAKQLAQKYFPDVYNIWARPNYEARWVEQACIEMGRWQKEQIIEQTCRWLLEHGMTQHVIERYRKDMEE